MNKLLVFAGLLCIDTATRERLLGLMTGVSQNAFANEPGVLKFGLFFPREESNDKLLYSIEEYANQAAFDSHLASKPVVDMFSWINSANIYERPPVFYSLESSKDLQFIRPELASTTDPYVVVKELYYEMGKLNQSMPSWKKVLSTSRNEKETLLFGAYPDPADSTHMFTIEALASKEYWANVHRASPAYLESENIWKAIGNRTEPSFLEMKGGFLYKPE